MQPWPRATFCSLATAITLATGPVWAGCGGSDVRALLPATDLAHVDEWIGDQPFGKGLLWQATKDGDRIVLAGSIHIPDPRLSPILDRLMPELDHAEVLMVEATDADQAAMQTALLGDPERILLPDNGSLLTLLPSDLWDRVAASAQAHGLPAIMAARMQPWYLSLTLAIPPCAMPDIIAGAGGLDAQIMAEADRMGLPQLSLEDWHDTLALLSEDPLEQQIIDMQLSVPDAGLDAAIFTAATAYYFEETPLASLKIAESATTLWPHGLTENEVAAALARTEQTLIADRNAAWVPVIAETMQHYDDALVVFGAAHLGGTQGVLAGLAADGWDVRPLP